MSRFLIVAITFACCTAFHGDVARHAFGQPPTIESNLRQQSISELAHRSHVLGDPERGAMIFSQPGLSCVQCHAFGDSPNRLGPDLSTVGLQPRADNTRLDEHIVESILEPSQQIRKGFESVKVLMDDGTIVTGLVQSETADLLVLVVPGEDDVKQIPIDEIESTAPAISLMPSGLINQLSDEQDFYDLVSFLVELNQSKTGDTQRWLSKIEELAPPPLPDYENDLDHARLIRSWDEESFEQGERLYHSLCINCHGTKDEPGSLPNALRFASGTFKNGSDPYSMYRTITHGYKMMLPQRQLVPRQKYDVIHYIREEFLKPRQADQYTKIDRHYLNGLPKGKRVGPKRSKEGAQEPWKEMDYGPFLISTYEIVDKDDPARLGITKAERRRAEKEGRPASEVWPKDTNFAYKGIAIRLDDAGSELTDDKVNRKKDVGGIAAGSHFVAFDHDTMRLAGSWSGTGFIDWRGILFNGNHAVAPRTVGDLHFENLPGPGWANPKTGSFEDPRPEGKDGRKYGPLPGDWAKYRGIYKFGDRVVVAYRIGDAEILENHSVERRTETQTQKSLNAVWTRTINVAKSSHEMILQIAPIGAVKAAVKSTRTPEIAVETDQGFHVVRIPAEQTPLRLELRIANPEVDATWLSTFDGVPEDLTLLTKGGPAQWPKQITKQLTAESESAFAVDTLSRPVKNPWNSRLRMSGLDFAGDGKSLVACCCDGDVWRVSGIDDPEQSLVWKRIASGLFHPLGIKIVKEKIFVTCRDQIVVLHDLNEDGETDFYQCFNNDHQVTDHFHEFAMGLQADGDGNLYYAKSARHARDSLVPHHGTLLKVSSDGAETEIIANGFRAANGVCLNPDGTFFVTDQEGHWNPMNRINRVRPGGFYGNMYSYDAPDDSSDDAMEQPLCWPNKSFDRSPSELLWVESDQWGPLNGSLLSLSYGYGKVFVVPHESVDGVDQGGMCRLPLPQFPTGIMRARFSPNDGQMYACGMHAWGSAQTTSPGGLYRIRYTGKPTHLPVGLSATKSGITITFTEPVDRELASDPRNFIVETWGLKRTANYGSDLYDEKQLIVDSVSVSPDGHSIAVVLPEIEPTWCMQISYKLKAANGQTFRGSIQNTVHWLK